MSWKKRLFLGLPLAEKPAAYAAADSLFDLRWYRSAYSDVAIAGADPRIHYIETGWAEGRRPHPLFDTEWYLTTYPDVAASGVNPFGHYLAIGAREGRDPNPLFSTAYYATSNSDVAAAGLLGLVHFAMAGGREGRLPSPMFDTPWYSKATPEAASFSDPLSHFLVAAPIDASPCPLFDARWYLQRNPDVAARGLSPVAHYLMRGASEGRDPHPLFDTDWYLDQNPDVAASAVNPLAHFIESGWREGRDPHPWFSTTYYLDRYADIRKGGRNPLTHFVEHGWKERRQPHPCFDINAYIKRTPALHKTASNALIHALETGRLEQREEQVAEPAAKLAEDPRGDPSAAQDLAALSAIGEAADWDTLSRAAQADVLDRAARSNPLISIVMPTWNRAHTIRVAIDSVLAQTYRNFELLVCDDASTDGTAEMLETAYPDQIAEGRLRILRLPKGGVSATRNAGQLAADGELIAYLDSDNAWEPNTLALYAAAAEAWPGRTVFYTPIRIVSSDDESDHGKVVGRRYDRTALLRSNFIDLNGLFHRRWLAHAFGGFSTRLTRLCDWELAIRYTRDLAPIYLPVISTAYHLDEAGLGNVTYTRPLKENADRVALIHRKEFVEHGVMRASKALALWTAPDVASQENTALYALAKTPPHGGWPVRIAIVVDPDMEEAWIADDEKARYPFVEAVLVRDGVWYRPAGENADRRQFHELEQTVFYWPTSTSNALGPSALMNAVLGIALNGIDFALVSHAGHGEGDADAVHVRHVRDGVVAAGAAAAAWLTDMTLPGYAEGRLMRLETDRSAGATTRMIDEALAGPFRIDLDGRRIHGPETREAPLHFDLSTLPLPELNNPAAIYLGMKVAVGGVERLTLNIATRLSDAFAPIYLALEPTAASQGSIAREIEARGPLLIEGCEIVDRSRYGRLLELLKDRYAPDFMLVMNGSIWLAENAALVREIFADTAIVDQQVYDHEVGWIQRITEPGLKSFDRLVAINKKIEAAFQAKGLPPDKIDLIHHGLDVERVEARLKTTTRSDARAAFGLPADGFVWVFAGRLVEQKRPLDFVALADRRRAHADEHFVLLGDGVLKEACEAAIRSAGLNNLTRLSFIEDVGALFAAADGLVVTSDYEGLPLVLVEAICMGLPVLATDVGEIRETLERFGAGVIQPTPGDVSALESKLGALKHDYRTLAARAGERAPKARRHFSMDTVAQLYLSAARKGLESRRAGQTDKAA